MQNLLKSKILWWWKEKLKGENGVNRGTGDGSGGYGLSYSSGGMLI